jgi:hypothetical protein
MLIIMTGYEAGRRGDIIPSKEKHPSSIQPLALIFSAYNITFYSPYSCHIISQIPS